jgi:dienelactone hydrolase
MSTMLLFHHAHGQTDGFLRFADDLRAAGHLVHTPDLYEGRTFDDLDEGVAFAATTGFDEIVRRGIASADDLPSDIVYAGFSLGVMPAQALAQTRRGSRGALLFHACVPPSEFGGPWPAGVPVQLHFMQGDPWAEEDLPVARALVAEIDVAELFVYPGSGHLFADPSLADHDAVSAGLLWERTLAFLERVG